MMRVFAMVPALLAVRCQAFGAIGGQMPDMMKADAVFRVGMYHAKPEVSAEDWNDLFAGIMDDWETEVQNNDVMVTAYPTPTSMAFGMVFENQAALDEYKTVGLKKYMARMGPMIEGKDFDFEGPLTYYTTSNLPASDGGILRLTGIEVKEGAEEEARMKMDQIMSTMDQEMPAGWIATKGSVIDGGKKIFMTMLFTDEASLDNYLMTTREMYLEMMGDLLVMPPIFEQRGPVQGTMLDGKTVFDGVRN